MHPVVIVLTHSKFLINNFSEAFVLEEFFLPLVSCRAQLIFLASVKEVFIADSTPKRFICRYVKLLRGNLASSVT